MDADGVRLTLASIRDGAGRSRGALTCVEGLLAGTALRLRQPGS